jgi:hypothetical protein
VSDVEYVATLTMVITEVDPLGGTTKTLVRKVSTGAHKGVAAAKAAYDGFTHDLHDCVYTEDHTTENTRRHLPVSEL